MPPSDPRGPAVARLPTSADTAPDRPDAPRGHGTAVGTVALADVPPALAGRSRAFPAECHHSIGHRIERNPARASSRRRAPPSRARRCSLEPPRDKRESPHQVRASPIGGRPALSPTSVPTCRSITTAASTRTARTDRHWPLASVARSPQRRVRAVTANRSREDLAHRPGVRARPQAEGGVDLGNLGTLQHDATPRRAATAHWHAKRRYRTGAAAPEAGPAPTTCGDVGTSPQGQRSGRRRPQRLDRTTDPSVCPRA